MNVRSNINLKRCSNYAVIIIKPSIARKCLVHLPVACLYMEWWSYVSLISSIGCFHIWTRVHCSAIYHNTMHPIYLFHWTSCLSFKSCGNWWFCYACYTCCYISLRKHSITKHWQHVYSVCLHCHVYLWKPCFKALLGCMFYFFHGCIHGMH